MFEAAGGRGLDSRARCARDTGERGVESGGMTWTGLNRAIVNCERCPRLRDHCRRMAEVKRASFRDETYWGRPIPNWAAGDLKSVRVLIMGLAPAAHGGNRTGRVFTGDRSGDFLFRAMYETGFCNQPTSRCKGDGLELIDCAISAVCHCAPPDNKPLPEEIENCRGFLDDTLRLLPGLRGIVALGKIGFDASVRMLERAGYAMPRRPVARFGHGAVAWSDNRERFVIGSYHPSQQNTFTGRLTPGMLRAVFETARDLAGISGSGVAR
jgi:uracil-DNA glycosylase